MKIKLLLLSISVLFIFSITKAQKFELSSNTTSVLEKGEKEVGVFSPLKIGLKNASEISVHPIFLFIIPNIAYKKQWKSTDKFTFTSKHQLTYPTLLLNLLSKEGIGGILPSTTKNPQLFKFNNSVLIGKTVANQNLTFNLGVDFTLALGNSTYKDIEFSVAYPRTYSFNNLFTPYLGMDINGNIVSGLYYDASVNLFLFLKENKGFMVEPKFQLAWKKEKWAIKAGTLLSYGQYPYGRDFLAYPVFDFMFSF